MADMTATSDWEQVLEAVMGWTLARRIVLIRHLLDSLVHEAESAPHRPVVARAGSRGQESASAPAPRPSEVVGPDPRMSHAPDELETIMVRAIERLQTGRPPPSDAEVRQILDDARWEKYH